MFVPQKHCFCFCQQSSRGSFTGLLIFFCIFVAFGNFLVALTNVAMFLNLNIV